MREENIQRNSRKRLNALILLVAFTAILLIVSTYAWFSTQKNVTLGGLAGKVNVAEGLQISLDALNWANEIDLTSDAEAYFAQTNADLGLDGSTGKEKLSLKNPWKNAADSSYQGRTNLVPSELLPVSTTAQNGEGIGLNDFNMYRGENESGIKLTGVEKVAAENASGYYAIDFFLQNSSSEEAMETDGDLLRIENGSTIRIDGGLSKEATGLQNTFRVAFAIFDDDGNDNNTLVNNTPSQAQILTSTTGAAREITDVAIWEPNASGAQVNGEAGAVTRYAAHVNYILQNNNRVTFSSDDRTEFTINSSNKFTADKAIPTYALTAASVTKANIDNIYNWDSEAAANGLVRQYTLQTPNSGVADSTQLISAKDATKAQFKIEPGKYVHMRMYVWLEGQDVDCINYASLGGSLKIDVGLSKPGSATDGTGGGG